MGGSSKQTIGYKYFAGLMVVIGNRIEKLLDINPDNRGWIMTEQEKGYLNAGNVDFIIDKQNIFGGSNQEGGWLGHLYVHTGDDNQEQNPYLKKQIGEDVSAYPNLSYLVFGGASNGEDGQLTFNNNKGFELVSMSGMLKDFMLWVKRIHVKNDGSAQWYDVKAEVPERKVNDGGGTEIADYKTKWYESRNENLTRLYPDVDKSPGYGTQFEKVDHSRDVGLIGVYEFNTSVAGHIDISVVIYDDSVKFTVTTGQQYSFMSSEPNPSGGIIEKYRIIMLGESEVSFRTDRPQEKDVVVNLNLSSNPTFDKSEWKYEYFIGDMNPIHKIREILTDDTAMGKPEYKINELNFQYSADRIWDECLGISWCIQEKSCKDALDELLYHIEAGLRINRQTGLYEVILFRDNLIDLDELLIFNESNIKSINFDIANLDESISSINVSYYDRELIKDSSFLLYENGLERTRGFSISENIDFPYFMNRRNAELVGNWKLKQLSSPTWKGSFKTGIIEARKINKYDVIKLSWKSKGLIDLPVRILNINLGDGVNNTVTLDFIEVIPYSNINYTSTNVDPSIDENISPQFNSNIAIEMPYFEAVQRFTQTQVDLELGNSPELGYLMASAARPQNNSLNAHLYTDRATGVYTNMSKVGVIDYCPAVYLDGLVGYLDIVLKVVNLDYVSEFGVSGFNGATSGTWILLNDEIMVYESFNPETMEITVKRGALDTIPQKHNSGIIFFSDEFSGFDPNQYVQGENVQYQVLTTTPSSIKGLELGDSKFAEFNSRAIRPYPPANVKFNNSYFPETLLVSNDIILTWVDRNRLQQTGGSILGFYDEGVTIEQNVTYSIELISENVVIHSANNITLNSYTIPALALIQNKPHKLKLWSVRDGFDSYQKFEHNFFVEAVSLILTATSFKDKVVGSTVPDANINVNVDETLTANMKFDGSEISGKAESGSIITIEIED